MNRLSLISGYKNGRSWLKDSYCTRPFKLANVGIYRQDPALYLMVMSSSPGILDGDHYDIDIRTESHSRLQLQSQSYQRLFNMKNGAQQQQRIHMEGQSVFSYVQHPVVPHENAVFKSHTIAHLEDDCQFTFGEIITCGRKHSGEVFRFSRLHNITEIYHRGKLILKDNLLLQPQLLPMQAIGQMEGYTHQATLLHINTGTADMETQLTALRQMLEEEQGIIGGVSLPDARCLVVRILGNGGEQLYDCLRKMQRYYWQHTGNNTVNETIKTAIA
ncbi:urease accessory protein UreD [Chitinophaga varians]|uniref:urease accessory protein UreD n=1 Tax=Chitinophaga varians TaxID=2202339 RepID=UPI00165FAABA|nr:urease accessory protein UreD [Chitinophaga varians]MBC9912036.1 urease accessory protein UreD [Chitinophaga varians]